MVEADRALAVFHSPHYLVHNNARLDHLASLELPLQGQSVLEPGAGVGDHTLFYLARDCRVTSVEPRPENCAAFRQNLLQAAPESQSRWTLVEGDITQLAILPQAEVVHAYGLLYHLDEPAAALALMAQKCDGLLLLETCLSFGVEANINPIVELLEDPSQAVTGHGCRPTRPWVWNALKALFPHVYATRAQPAHPEFPLDWTGEAPGPLVRAVFVASREPLRSKHLLSELPDRYVQLGS